MKPKPQTTSCIDIYLEDDTEQTDVKIEDDKIPLISAIAGGLG